MNRIDTKFVTTESVLDYILSQAAEQGYRAFVVNGHKQTTYNSCYYDTESLRMFMDHRNGKLTRQKVRTRTYLENGVTYLEVKQKNNKGRTKKKRIEMPQTFFVDFRSHAPAVDFLALHSAWNKEEIEPVLETLFRRITLVNPDLTERLTIDTELLFRNRRNGHEATLGDAVIIELKQDGRVYSPMRDILLGLRVKPMRISKYCMAVTLTEPAVRAGRYKMKARLMYKLTNNKIRIS